MHWRHLFIFNFEVYLKQKHTSSHLYEVVAALAIALAVVVIFDSHGLFNWSRGLKVSEFNRSVKDRFKSLPWILIQLFVT